MVQGGDLPELQTAVGVEDEYVPLGLFQCQHRPSQNLRLLCPEHGRFRRGRGVGQCQLFVGGVGVAAPAAALPQPSVFADAAQPGVQAAATFKTVDVEEGLVEGLLQQLLRLLLVAGQGEEEPVNRLALGGIEFFKSPHGHSSFPMMP